MTFNSLRALSLTICLSVTGLFLQAQAPGEKPMVFKNGKGETVDAFHGTLSVPENRQNADSRSIKLAYVRFPSTNPNPGHPIIYLAGGPGGSGIQTAKGRRFPLFMALREVADVIAFDQRGTGESNHIPVCMHQGAYPQGLAMTMENALPIMRKDAEACARFWTEQGVDLKGYNTRESAQDLHALRQHLGAKKLNLWGISYGSHLAFAALAQMEDRIDRVVLCSSEGLDHTLKLPGWSNAFFNRIQQVINEDPATREKYPNLVQTMRRVHAKLAKEAVTVVLSDQDPDNPIQITLGEEAIQLFTSFALIKNPSNISRLPATYAAMDAGHFDTIAGILYQGFLANPGRTSGMPPAMDDASGISPARFARFQHESKTGILGKMLNFPFPFLFGAYGDLDLGESFRKPLKTATPTLFFSGTLDGRTFPEETWEIMRGFENGYQVIVENAGHDLFMSHPDVGKAIIRFFKDGSLQKTHIYVDPPQFQ